jgi:DNA-binding transcriptional regulator YiaG
MRKKKKSPMFTKYMKKFREDSGRTQEQAARFMAVRLTTLQKWERGVNLPDFFMVGRLLSVFGEQGWKIMQSMDMNESEIRAVCKGFMARA